MDPKHQENYLKKNDEKSLEKLQSRAIFNDPSYYFVFKKTEKIVAALYLVSNLISDTEPIKWQMRKKCMDLMSDILVFKRQSTFQLKQNISKVTVDITEIISLLKISSMSDLISTMNCSILQKELTMLMESINNLHPEMVGNSSSLLSPEFFNVPAPMTTNAPSFFQGNFSAQHLSKGQYRTHENIKDEIASNSAKDNVKDIKNNRREKILQLLKAGKPLGIKDFAKEIKDCSEKTIQRELLDMLESGLLKKKGERRWSQYFLA